MNEPIIDDNLLTLMRTRFGLIGRSRPMIEAIKTLAQAAPTDLGVLITGETGTGKEVFAGALHGLSERAKRPFIGVNCGAIPETLLESELFGHEKGAFTGATDRRKGYFEVADKGTIFLDEIGEMPLGTQVKLLRVLESGEFARLGSTAVIKTDVRVVAATNRNLDEEVEKGNFRRDLYFRLNAVHINLPPLREHLSDMEPLVDFFANKVAKKLNLDYEGVSDDALSVLRSQPWQGNVRELKNLIETMMTLEKATYIGEKIVRKYIARALPPAQYRPQKENSALELYEDYDNPTRLELEVIFRTLLEIKNEINSLRNDVDSVRETVNAVYDAQAAAVEKLDETGAVLDEENLRLDELERRAIFAALEKFGGNRKQAAAALGVSERTLYRKLSDYDFRD